MKYLRTYEGLKVSIRPPVKEELPMYYIYHGFDSGIGQYIFMILEIYDITEVGSFRVKKLYRFSNNKLQKIGQVHQDINVPLRNIFRLKKLIYGSKDLQECLDILPIIVDAKKYNL